MDRLIKLTARQAVELLKKREVTPLELIDAAVHRIEETDGTLNALPTLCVERARAHAKNLMSKEVVDPPSGYLYGLPFAVKDLQDVGGVRCTKGSPIFADHIPERSDYLVETIEGKGGIVLAKSNTPEFGAGGNTFNEVFGKTHNPWNTAMTCGGSSGGSAVALATGQVWLATGSDLGGSLRLPASFCSVVGLRPSPGRVAYGPKSMPFSTLSVDGPMGRTVGDVALFLDAQAGRHPGDPISFPAPELPYVSAVDKAMPPRRVAFSPDLGVASVDSEVREVCAKAARLFESMGATVEEDTIDLHDAEETFQTLRAAQFVGSYASLLDTHRDQLKPEVIWNIEKGLQLTADEIARAELARGALFHRTAEFFRRYDLLLCPAAAVPPFDVDTRYVTEINGIELENYIAWALITFAVTLTACPAISVPCGFTRSGLPVGLQIVGPWAREDTVLSAAALFEQSTGLATELPMEPRVKAAN
jgi:amidase